MHACCALVCVAQMNRAECLVELMDLAKSLVSFLSILASRKDKDIVTLGQRLITHAEERRDAIARDNVRNHGRVPSRSFAFD